VCSSDLASAGVQKLEREVLFLKPNTVVVFDRVQTTTAADADWLLNSPLTAVAAGNAVTFTGAHGTLVATRVLPATATTTLAAWPTLNSDVSAGHRLAWRGAGPFLVVLSTDGDVLSAVGNDATGQRGVELSLNGGRSATVRFFEGQRGGTLQLRATGAPTRDVTLTPSVMALPRFRVP